MNNLLGAAIGALCGLLMGLIFFGGLWFTVGRLAASRNPMRLLLASFLIRTTALVPCCYGLARFGGWTAVMGGLTGLLLMRIILIGVLRREPTGKPLSVGDAR